MTLGSSELNSPCREGSCRAVCAVATGLQTDLRETPETPAPPARLLNVSGTVEGCVLSESAAVFSSTAVLLVGC